MRSQGSVSILTFPEKVIFCALETESYILHAQIFSWSVEQLSTSTRLWAHWIVRYWWLGSMVGCLLIRHV